MISLVKEYITEFISPKLLNVNKYITQWAFVMDFRKLIKQLEELVGPQEISIREEIAAFEVFFLLQATKIN